MARTDKLRARRDNVRIAIVAIEGGLTVAVDGLVDAFAVANHWWRVHRGDLSRRFEVTVVAATPSVRSFTGRPLAIDAALPSWSGGDVLICSAVAIDPLKSLQRNATLVAWLRDQARRPKLTIASVCTGAFFLAEAGLLSGKCATTNPLFAEAFGQRYPDVRLALSRVLVDEGSRITAGTVSAGLNLAFYLIERYAGVEVAALTARAFAVDKNRETQDPYLIPARRLADGDELAVRTQRWIERHYAKPDLSLATIAAAQAVGARTLQRRFLAATRDAPMDYLRRVRLEAAKRLLETTREPIDQITWRVGYRDPRSFARWFRDYVALTPTAYRAKFGAALP